VTDGVEDGSQIFSRIKSILGRRAQCRHRHHLGRRHVSSSLRPFHSSGVALFVPRPRRSRQPAETVSDRAFWKLVTEFSELTDFSLGQFHLNERPSRKSFPSSRSACRQTGVPRRGPDQNFTVHHGAPSAHGVHHRYPPPETCSSTMYKAIIERSRSAPISCRAVLAPASGRPRSDDAGQPDVRRVQSRPVEEKLFAKNLQDVLGPPRETHGRPCPTIAAASIHYRAFYSEGRLRTPSAQQVGRDGSRTTWS